MPFPKTFAFDGVMRCRQMVEAIADTPDKMSEIKRNALYLHFDESVMSILVRYSGLFVDRPKLFPWMGSGEVRSGSFQVCRMRRDRRRHGNAGERRLGPLASESEEPCGLLD